MTFFESLVVLLAFAVLLLQVARRAGLPYPAMLAAAGMVVAMIPGTPAIQIEPHTALALFIAPILVDAAFDFPVKAARALMEPLLVYAVLAVVVTALLVAEIGVTMLGLPLAAALAVGAVVAPPDAAAATAVLSSLPVSRRIDAVLKGESLFNDATALLLFTAALAVWRSGDLDAETALRIGVAAPGGIAFGMAFGWAAHQVQRFVENTVGGTILQFVSAFATWLIAERLELSAVLATVASAMTIAWLTPHGSSPRMRVHSYAVWTTVVFLLNVIAFLVMGMQARAIVAELSGAEFARALRFAGAVVVTVIVARLAVAYGYRLVRVLKFRVGNGPQPVRPAESVLIGWSGMRGLVTLATAFALPADFPERDTVVLAAFAVIVATVVVQGVTLGPFIRWAGIAQQKEAAAEMAEAQKALAMAALARLEGEDGAEAEELRDVYRRVAHGDDNREARAGLHRRHGLALAAVLAQRNELERLRDEQKLGVEGYLQLQEALDWRQLAVMSDEDRRLMEG